MSGAVRIDRRLYLTADRSRAVEEDDPAAATLLCPAGGEVPHATAARYGLLAETQPDATPEPELDAEKKAPTAPNKAGRRPADKSRTPEGDK